MPNERPNSPNSPSSSSPSSKQFQTIPWDAIKEPGAYVSCDTGRLYRVPPQGLSPSHSPLIQVLGPQGKEKVTCLSDNPDTPVDKLRLVAADANIEPRF
jgi:hypothetical protein